MPFSSNLLFNSPTCTMIVKGINARDEDLLGRLRDNFAILLTIIESRIDFIEVQLEENNNIRKIALNNLKSQLIEDFVTIKRLCLEQDTKVKMLVNDLSQMVQSKMITLGLDEAQESELMGLIDETKDVVEETLVLSFTLEDKLQAMTKRLKAVE